MHGSEKGFHLSKNTSPRPWRLKVLSKTDTYATARRDAR
jgi:hypothetical protein